MNAAVTDRHFWQAEKRNIIESYISAYNAFDVEGMLSHVHQDIEFRNFTENELNVSAKDIPELRRLAEQSKALFASRRQTITALKAMDDSISAEIEFEAILAVDLPNGMKAGDALHLTGRSEFRFKDGKLYRIDDYS